MTGARKLRPCSGGSEPPRCAVGPPRACEREKTMKKRRDGRERRMG
jgi:hypothetical protein